MNGDLPDEQKLDDPLGELLEIQPEFRGELDQMRMKYKKVDSHAWCRHS